MSLIKAFQELASRLYGAVLIGGFGLSYYRPSHQTKDLDFTVPSPPDFAPDIKLRQTIEDEFSTVYRCDYKGVAVDFTYEKFEQYRQALFRDAPLLELHGRKFRIATLEDILVTMLHKQKPNLDLARQIMLMLMLPSHTSLKAKARLAGSVLPSESSRCADPTQRVRELASEGEKLGEFPVGAVVLSRTGELLGEAYNERYRLKDATAHAEMLAIKKACVRLGLPVLSGCSLYTSLEPCPMCLAAARVARISRVIYLAKDPTGGALSVGCELRSFLPQHQMELEYKK